MKKDRLGQAEIFTPQDIKKIRKHFANPLQLALFEIMLFTGERVGAVRQLRVSDIYLDAERGKFRDFITFSGDTRKGNDETRQVAMNPDLAHRLRCCYDPPEEGYLFPSNGNPNTPISYNGVYVYWREKLKDAGLDHRGFSLHSPRRTYITNLHKAGRSLKEIQASTKHKSLSSLIRYIEVDPTRISQMEKGYDPMAA